MRSNPLRRTICLVLLLWPFAALAAGPVFVKIADTATAVPGGFGNFSFFGSNSAASVIAPNYDGSSILFSGLDSQNHGGLYRWSSGSLSMVANTSTTVPGGSTTFAHFLGSSISGTRIAFLADDNQQTGVYEIDGQILPIASTATNAPGTSSPFTGFSRPIATIRGPWYSGTYSTTSGPASSVYNYFQTEVGPSTPVPGGTGNFSYAANPDENIYVAFFGRDANQKEGIYLLFDNPPNGSSITVAADTNTTIPGTGLKFATFDSNSISISGQGVAFSAEDQNGRAYIIKRLLSGFQSGLKFVTADVGHPPLSMSGEYIAYLRQGALYTDSNISTNPRLVGPGDTLFGKTVSSLSIGPDAFVGNNIAFAATFSDGSQGVFIVGVPEPSMIAGLLPLALLLRRRRTLNAWMITP